MPKQRDVKAKICQSKGMSKQRDVKAKGCQRKRDATAKRCQSKGMSKQSKKEIKAQGWEVEVSHGSFVFTSSTFTLWGASREKASFSHLQLSLFEGRSCMKASFSHLPLSLFEGRLARKLSFQIFHFHFLRDVSHKSFVFTSSTFIFWGTSRTKASFHIFIFIFWGTSRTKASFSHLALSLFGDISHGIRLNWDARNVVFCRTKRGANGWGSFSGGRLRNRFVCTGIMVGSAALWNWQFRRCFADVLARSSIVFCNSVFADRIVMAASRLLGAAVEWLHQGCHSDLSADFLNFGAGDFPLKIQWKSASKSSFYCFGIEIRFWSCNFWRRCA